MMRALTFFTHVREETTLSSFTFVFVIAEAVAICLFCFITPFIWGSVEKGPINSTVVTPIKVEKFEHWLQGYNEKEKDFLLTGFKFGFNIPYVGKREYRYGYQTVAVFQICF
jgi:hypothetical protein